VSNQTLSEIRNLCSFVVSLAKNIIGSSTVLQESTKKLNESIQAYSMTIGALQLKLSVAAFKQGQDVPNILRTMFDQIESRMESRMESLEPEIRTFASLCLCY
jgi:hypothetical protein